MSEPTITCPSCAAEIKLTESLAGPLIEATKKEFENKLAAQTKQIDQREKVLIQKEAEMNDIRQTIEEDMAQRLESERIKIVQVEAHKAQIAVANDLEGKAREVVALGEILRQKDEKLAEAQEEQVLMLKQKRALDDQKRELELTIEKRVQKKVDEVRVQAKSEIEGELSLKITEKEETIRSMKGQIEVLKRKADQGSQQIQGEAFELELEQLLRGSFPSDGIEPVAKGEAGGDIVQIVTSQMGLQSGKILWELKRTKNWSEGWLAKLRNDQRESKADISILVSVALPKSIESFGLVEGVWVSSPRYVIPVATVLRQTLIALAQSKQSREGQQTKMELIYNYLMGPNFKHRVEAIVEKVSDMQIDLDREKKAMMKLWAKRDGQIHGVVEATVGMYGDFQGIAGRALQEIEGLELPLIEQNNSLFDDEKL